MHSAGKMRIGVIGSNHSSWLMKKFQGISRKHSRNVHRHVPKTSQKYSRHIPKIFPSESFDEKCSWAHADGVADLLWVEVVVDQPVDDGGQLGLHQGVAMLLDAGPEKTAQGVAQLLEELHALVLGGVAGDEVVEVGDDVDADGAGQLVPALGHGLGGRHEGGEEEEGCLHLACSLRCFS